MAKSSPISLREGDYGSLTSRERKALASVLLQMPERDEERGRRIARLREDRDLSQPQVIEALKEQEGGKVIGLRGYQLWEAGGGISSDNLRALARFHGVSTDWIKRGDTPDLLETSNGRPATIGADVREQLDRIERKLDELLSRPGPAESPTQDPDSQGDEHLVPDRLPDVPDEDESSSRAAG